MEKSQATATADDDVPFKSMVDSSKSDQPQEIAESRSFKEREAHDKPCEPPPSSSSSRVLESIAGGPKPQTRPSYLSDARSQKKGNPSRGVVQKKRRGEFDSHSVTLVRADDLRDPEWMKGISFDTAKSKVSHGEPHQFPLNGDSQPLDASKDDRKKHQINYLALELKQNEEILLAKIAAGKEKQKSASMKYGW
jgi:hypothetical protein